MSAPSPSRLSASEDPNLVAQDVAAHAAELAALPAPDLGALYAEMKTRVDTMDRELQRWRPRVRRASRNPGHARNDEGRKPSTVASPTESLSTRLMESRDMNYNTSQGEDKQQDDLEQKQDALSQMLHAGYHLDQKCLTPADAGGNQSEGKDAADIDDVRVPLSFLLHQNDVQTLPSRMKRSWTCRIFSLLLVILVMVLFFIYVGQDAELLLYKSNDVPASCTPNYMLQPFLIYNLGTEDMGQGGIPCSLPVSNDPQFPNATIPCYITLSLMNGVHLPSDSLIREFLKTEFLRGNDLFTPLQLRDPVNITEPMPGLLGAPMRMYMRDVYNLGSSNLVTFRLQLVVAIPGDTIPTGWPMQPSSMMVDNLGTLRDVLRGNLLSGSLTDLQVDWIQFESPWNSCMRTRWQGFDFWSSMYNTVSNVLNHFVLLLTFIAAAGAKQRIRQELERHEIRRRRDRLNHNPLPVYSLYHSLVDGEKPTLGPDSFSAALEEASDGAKRMILCNYACCKESDPDEQERKAIERKEAQREPPAQDGAIIERGVLRRGAVPPS